MTTITNRVSSHQGLYQVDIYGLEYTPFPPNIHKLLMKLNQLDSEMKQVRTELNLEAEQWLVKNNLGYYYNLDAPEGPIAFFKRQSQQKGYTLITHLRNKASVVAIIKKIEAANNK